MITNDFKDFNLAVNTYIDKRKLVTVDVGNDRQLLFDDVFIALGKRYDQYPYKIKWVVAPVEKHGGPIMEPHLDWEDSVAWFSVLREGGKYRMWYNSRHGSTGHLVVSYAESDDCVNFERKNIGLIDYQGSKDNNIVFTGGINGVTVEMGNVFIDPYADEVVSS